VHGERVGVRVRAERKRDVRRSGRTLIRLPPPSPEGRRVPVWNGEVIPSPSGRGAGVRVRAERENDVHRSAAPSSGCRYFLPVHHLVNEEKGFQIEN
jgi:hypothetical protein